MSDTLFAFNRTEIDLSGRNLNEDELLPLLESFKQGTFRNLITLNLVILFAFDVGCSLSLVCCRMEMVLEIEAPS